MPGYTRPWSEVNFLLGTRDADEIDDASRETHLDLTERFTDIVEDVEADPWVLKNTVTSVITRYHWSLGFPFPVGGGSSSVQVSGDGSFVYPGGGASGEVSILIPVPVPLGQELKWVAVRLRQATDAIASATLRVVFPDGLTAILGTAPAATGTGWENRVIEGAPVEVAAEALMSFFLGVRLENSSSGIASFLDMEVSTVPVVTP